MTCALPVGEAEVDEMPDEGIKEITNSRMVLAAAETVLGEYLFPDAAHEKDNNESVHIRHHLDSSDSSGDDESDGEEVWHRSTATYFGTCCFRFGCH